MKYFCFIKPNEYTCRNCVENQEAFNVSVNCSECIKQSEVYEILEFVDHGAVVMDKECNVKRVSYDDIKILKEGEKTDNV